MYERFREILACNDATLELIAHIEELLGGKCHYSHRSMVQRVRKAAMGVFLMVKDLNLIADRRHQALYGALHGLNDLLEAELAPAGEAVAGKHVVSLACLRAGDAHLAGYKMANLGEIGADCGLAIPEGFAITTASFLRFMADGDLWNQCEKLDSCLEDGDSQSLADACRSMQSAIRGTPVPTDVSSAIHKSFAAHFPQAGALVAMRSSAVGEDSAVSSHAGLYYTELNVDAAHLLDAYRAVLASAFSPTAVSYRFQRGIAIRDSLMAVGCVRMIQPRCAGIVYSRLPDEPEEDAVIISATLGLAHGIAAGDDSAAKTWVVTPGRIQGAGPLLSDSEARELVEAARRLEEHFGTPQDIEWAIDGESALVFLQARPMVVAYQAPAGSREGIADGVPLIEGGYTACPGIGSGPVVLADANYDLNRFPEAAVLVARHSSPAYAQVMERCAAIVTDVGSPTGHMASLVREFEIPTIVGVQSATRALQDGQVVTVDAFNCRIYNGAIPYPASPTRRRTPPADSPALERLRRIARLVTPLTMTDPASPDFLPDNCHSLHDITRYVHEKVFEAMFHYGDLASEDRDHSRRLEAKLPIRVEVFDVGGGIGPEAGAGRSVLPGQIRSIPLLAFLQGLLDPRIRWDMPRPVSVRGFLSVLGESITGPPPDSSQIGRLSYAIISDRYMNFSTKAGYHFSTIDTYCGKSVNKNYIHFRFSGGAADSVRRARRIQFVSRILSALDFRVTESGDTLVARFSKYGAEDIQARLASLGRLTLCARQLDMLMDNDSSPDLFAQAFLSGEWHKF